MAFRVAPQRQQQPPTPVTPSMPSNLPLPLVPDSFTPLPMTPPDPEGDWSPEDDTHIITTGLHVLATDRIAFQHIEKLYALDPMTQKYFAQTVKKTVDCVSNHGKVVVCGVGKSGAIGQKIVATMNSLGILSVFLHPTEALHGDLGIIRPVGHYLHVPAAQGSLANGGRTTSSCSSASPAGRRNFSIFYNIYLSPTRLLD
jgi:hypothetical protein